MYPSAEQLAVFASEIVRVTVHSDTIQTSTPLTGQMTQ